uniref:SSD domain-containing protein n=1 Tax=Aureoumbra lagunensis TaxID=44058 RepID=A0A7S3K155_9STRA
MTNYCAWELQVANDIQEEWPCSSGSCFIRTVESYCILKNMVNATDTLAATFLETDASSIQQAQRAIIIIEYNARASKTKKDRLINWTLRRARSLRSALKIDIDVGTTGFEVITKSATDGTKKDLESVDTISLPIALGVMALTLGSITILILPIINMLLATILAFAVVSKIATTYDIVAFAPSVMMSLILAVSFDYSLFLCSRFLEARREFPLPCIDRIIIVLETAGHTILVSGSTLIVCFLSLLVFPSPTLRGLGVAISVGLFSALFFNLTLTPALLHLLGEPLGALNDALISFIFSLPSYASSKQRQRTSSTTSRGLRLVVDENTGDDHDEEQKSYDLLDDDYSDSVADIGGTLASVHWKDNVFTRLTRFMWEDRRLAIFVVILVAVVSAPCSRYCLQLRPNAEPTALSPIPSQPEQTYSDVESYFGGGAVAPYTILFAGSTKKKQASVLSDYALEAMDTILYNRLVNATKSAGPLTITSLTRLGNKRIYNADYTACLLRNGQPPHFPVSACSSILTLMVEFSSTDRQSALAQVVTSSSAYSRAGFAWIEDARDVLRHAHINATLDLASDGIYLDGSAAQLYDTIRSLFASFPWVIVSTLSLVFVLLGAAFRSIAVPARSVIALCLTLSFSFGTLVLVYQRRSSRDPEFLSTRGTGKGIAWLAPLICLSISVGLAVDYDVFLLARVYHYRFALQLDDKNALLAAVGHTSTIITSAGCIMAISFGGLFLSHAPVLNECAWLLCSAVLYDTFIIRTLFMPALLSLSREYAWWPNKPPVPAAATLAAVSSSTTTPAHSTNIILAEEHARPLLISSTSSSSSSAVVIVPSS